MPDAEYMRRYRASNPDYVRRMNLRRLYGIDLEDYDAMRAAQDYRCAICARHEDELPTSKAGRPRKDGSPTTTPGRLVVDHCHLSKSVRKLLCQRCNVLLGQACDDLSILYKAIAYLQGHGTTG